LMSGRHMLLVNFAAARSGRGDRPANMFHGG
jgi:hypothetical protein